MKMALLLVTVFTVAAFATGEFSTNGAELWKFKGYGIFRFDVFGQEDISPDMAFCTSADVAWEPRLNDMLSARAELQMNATGEGYADLKDAYLNLDPVEALTIRGGQFHRNIGWGEMESTTAMLFPNRPLYTSYGLFSKYGKRDMGAMLIGTFDMVTLDLAYTNGVVENAENDSNKQFTVHGEAAPADWVTIGLGMGVYAADDSTTSEADDTFSSTAFDAYGIVDYPISETAELHFTGEYMMLGYADGDVEGMEKTGASVMTAALGATFDLEGAMITGITPMLRYEQISPATQLAEGAADPEDNYGAIDGCVNLHMGDNNVLQLGLRNYMYEADSPDGYTDMTVNWRMNF